MANTTVYPYGTGGSLPSSVGIINDLKTGGVDKALSAEQGVVIGDYLFDQWVAQSLPTTLSNYYLGSGSSWAGNGKHIVYPVTPGDRIRLSVTSAANSAWYGFLDSTYTPPASYTTIPYATGQSRRQLTYNTTIELTVPEGAAYLCMCPIDWDGNSYTWGLEILNPADIKEDFVAKDSDELRSIVFDPCDISEYETRDCFTGPSKWDYSVYAQQQHKVIPVTGGQKIKLRCLNSTNGGNYYSWLTSAYTIPSNGDTIPYANSTSRIWLNDSAGQVELTAPSAAAYLCITMRNGTGSPGATSNWEVFLGQNVSLKEEVEDYTLKYTDVVNNTTDGGVDVPLSAEQGKLLAEKVSDGMPAGATKYAYEGALVKVSRTHYVSAKKVASIGSDMFQGAACYGNFLVAFTSASGHSVWIYNLTTGAKVATTSIPDEELGFVSNPHFNTVNFGTKKYDEDDPFPLIYASTGYSDETNTGALVYRIIATTENDVTTYSLELVQTLKMPGTGWTEFIVGDEDDCYLCYTTSKIIYRMKMPTLAQGDITFDLSQALDVYKFTPKPAWYNGSSGQGGLYHNGLIYFAMGEPSKSQTLLFVGLDLATGRRVVEIDLGNTFGITYEPEAVFIWNGHFCIAFRVGGVYTLYFD